MRRVLATVPHGEWVAARGHPKAVGHGEGVTLTPSPTCLPTLELKSIEGRTISLPEEDVKPRTERDTYSAFERRMIRASQEKTPVIFKMATDEIITGFVLSVGDDLIEVDETLVGPIWLGRTMILSARVVKGL